MEGLPSRIKRAVGGGLTLRPVPVIVTRVVRSFVPDVGLIDWIPSELGTICVVRDGTKDILR